MEREKGITELVAELAVPKPELNHVWNLNGYSTDQQDIDNIINGPKWIIFQIYSRSCGFCRKAIPAMNALHQSDDFSVIGVVGNSSDASFGDHSQTNNIN